MHQRLIVVFLVVFIYTMSALQRNSHLVPISPPHCACSLSNMSESPKHKEDLAELGAKDEQIEDVVFGEITDEGPNYRSVRIPGS